MAGKVFNTSFNDKHRGLAGVNSGLDWHKIIRDSNEIMLKPAKKKEEDIQFVDNKKLAFVEMRDLISRYQEANDKMRNNLSIFNNGGNNVLRQTIIDVNVSNGGIGSSYVEVSTNSLFDGDSGFLMTISSLATTKLVESMSFASLTNSITQADNSNNNLLTPGTFTITGPNGNADVIVEAGETLSSLRYKIDAVKLQTGVNARIVSPASNSYTLQLESTKTGVANGFTLQDNNNVLNKVFQKASTSAPITYSENVIRTPTDAVFTYNGSTITRSSNVITDYMPGLTLKLKAVPPNGSVISIGIRNDTEAAMAGIEEWVDTYNNLLKFRARQERLSPGGGYHEEAYLRNDPTFTRIMRQLNDLAHAQPIAASQMAHQWGWDASYAVSLTPFGIMQDLNLPENAETNEPEYLQLLRIDRAKLSENLSLDMQGIRQWFEFSYKENSGKFMIISQGTKLPNEITSFTVSVDPTGANPTSITLPSGQSISAAYNASSGSSGRIIPDANSVLANYVFTYSGDTPSSSTFYLSRGIAERSYWAIKSYFTPTVHPITGNSVADVFSAEIIDLSVERTNLTKDIRTIQQRAETKREEMEEKFAKMEATMSKLQTVETMFDAVFNTKDR